MIDQPMGKLARPLLLLGTFALTAAVWLLGRHHAYHEPHYYFRGSDVLLYVGMNLVLTTLLVELAALMVFGAVTRRLGWWWMVAVLLVALHVPLSVGGARRWIHDQEWRQFMESKEDVESALRGNGADGAWQAPRAAASP